MSDSEWARVKADQLRRVLQARRGSGPCSGRSPARARPSPALAPPKRGNRPPSNRRPVRAPITEDENIF